MQTLRTTIYSVCGSMHLEQGEDANGHHPGLSITRRMLTEVIEARELIWRLFWRDFLARYRQSALGLAWVILQPLLLVGLFLAMSQAGVFVAGRLDLPYVLYALTGLTLWQVFAGGVSACSVALVDAGSLLGKVNFARSALVLAAFGQAVAEFLIRCGLTALAYASYGVWPDGMGLLAALGALLPLCLLALGIGFVLALAAALFRDAINATTLALSGLLLVTPVLYPLRDDSLLGALNAINPLKPLIALPRDLMLRGHSDDLPAFLIASTVALLVFIVGWRLFFVAQPHIAERV